MIPTPTDCIEVPDGWRLFFYGKREVSGTVYDTEEIWKKRWDDYGESIGHRR